MVDKIDSRYEVIKTLGVGLSGEVLAVSDHEGKKALKFLKRVQFNLSKEETLTNFKNEFSILKELSHPGIARILDFGFDPKINKYYFTTELVEGDDFFSTAQTISVEIIEELAVQTLRALSYLHSRRVYHFDIKPQNILIKKNDSSFISKIIDFGLANFSSPRKKVGTPAYMAPEIILGGNLDGRTDLYSFGVVLYKSFTNQNPFASKEIRETLDRQKNLAPPPPSTINSQVPKYWDHILARLLEKNPSKRYSQASDVIRDINFLANKNYDIETIDTRLSYVPEKGMMIGRKKEFEIFTNLFKTIFKENNPQTSRLLVVEGKEGTGKSRLLQEFKYYSQLHDIPVVTWKDFENSEKQFPLSLIIENDKEITPDLVNQTLQRHANDKILILWATHQAPQGWSHCETIKLTNFNEQELADYLTSVTGLKDPPQKLIKGMHQRTEGNPLFVTELLKSMLGSNLLLDSSGRWISATFEDIEINFEKIQVPHSVSELLLKKYQALAEKEKNILEWLAVFNRPLALEELRKLCKILHPQTYLLALTQKDCVERTTREHHYFFSNTLLRDAIYTHLSVSKKQQLHDQAAFYLGDSKEKKENYLFHRGRGVKDDEAIIALEELGELYLKQEKYPEAITTLELAWKRAQNLDTNIQVNIETLLAESLVKGRQYQEAANHYQHLRKLFEEGLSLNTSLDMQSKIYEKLGELHIRLELFEEALKLFYKALPLVEQLPNSKIRKMIVENLIAAAYMHSGQIEKAEDMFRSNYIRWEENFALEEKKQVTNNRITQLLIIKKEFNEALDYIKKDISFFEEVQDPYYLAQAYYEQGDLFYKKMFTGSGEKSLSHRDESIACFEKCLDLAKKIPDLSFMLRAYNGIGSIYFNEQKYDQALNFYQRALALARKKHDLLSAATISHNIGNIHRFQENLKDAYSYYVYGINTLESIEPKNYHIWFQIVLTLFELQENYRETGNLVKAEETLTHIEEIMSHHPTMMASHEFYLHFERAKIYKAQGHEALCKASLEKAEKLAEDTVDLENLQKFKGEKSSLTFKTMEQNKTVGNEDQLQKILQLNKFLNSEHDPEHLLKMVLHYALELSGAESGLVILVNAEGELEVKASVNTEVNEELKKVSTSAAKKAIETGEVVISEDALSDQRFDSSESVILNELKSILCMPLKSRNKIVGVLYLDNRYQTNAFLSANLNLLHAYCDQVGIALENARLIAGYRDIQSKLEKQLQETNEELVEVKERLQEETSLYMTKYSYDNIITKDKQVQEIFKVLDKIIETNLAVCIYGASGTGKELIAKAIHYNNTLRAKNRFVAINCGAIPANLMESELFGYKAGSFTGANKDKKGLFEEANGGTIFLDEIAELDNSLQVKLLRILQDGEVHRIGDVKTTKVDVRIICASHKNLEAEVKATRFREDLFYRLCQIKVALPSLTQRKDDIPLLADHFIQKFRKENEISEKIKISPNLIKIFFQYPWPGNIRELENVINVSCALRESNVLDVTSLPPNHAIHQFLKDSGMQNLTILGAQNINGEIAQMPMVMIDEKNPYDSSKTWENYETLIIAKCYAENGFKKTDAADMLGISPSTLYKKIKDHDLENQENPIYKNTFVYQKGRSLKDYIPLVFQASLKFAQDHPYAAIRQLGISQGYFYKIMNSWKKAGVA